MGFKQCMRVAIIGLLAFIMTVTAGCSTTNTSNRLDPEIKEPISTVAHSAVIGQAAPTKDEDNNPSSSAVDNEDDDSPRLIPAKAINIVDGDTLDVRFENGKEERIRLLLVDTPETKAPGKAVQPFGPEASQYAKDILEGKEIGVEIDVSERDKYGRLLAYIWIDDKIFNEMLLEQGLARVAYIYPPNIKYVDQFRDVQKAAQKAGVGIWSIDGYVSSNGFQDGVGEKSKPANETPAQPDVAGCSDPAIKGNINSKGEKVYHIPGGQFYDQTKPEEMFCSEADAITAGFRASKR